MTLNPSRTVRVVIYLVTALGTPLVAYLNARGIIGSLEVSFWSAEVAVATGLAALNVNSAPAEVAALIESRDRLAREVGESVRRADET